MKKQNYSNKLVVAIKNPSKVYNLKTDTYLKRYTKTEQFLGIFAMRSMVIALILSSLFGCEKNSLTPQGVEKIVVGTVFEDCNGNVSQEKKVYLHYYQTGCFGGGVISIDSTLTNEHGHFKFHYIQLEEEESTTSYYHTLTIPNSSINLYNPNGNFELYPNETKMNAVIHLKFRDSYTSSDTFYFQFRPTHDGFVQEPELTQFFVGPFHDTTLVLNNLTVGNVNNSDHGKHYSGFFRWAIGKNRLNRYYTGRDGYFDLTHQPCAPVDTFEYYADPI